MNNVKGMQEDTHDTNKNHNPGTCINYYVFETLKHIIGALNVSWEPPNTFAQFCISRIRWRIEECTNKNLDNFGSNPYFFKWALIIDLNIGLPTTQ